MGFSINQALLGAGGASLGSCYELEILHLADFVLHL